LTTQTDPTDQLTTAPNGAAADDVPTPRVIEVAGVDINYHDVGTGHPVVLLHGSGPGATAKSNFSHNISVLAKSLRVIALDAPGWGDSGAWGDALPPTVALLEHLGVERAALVGNSMGGMTALRIAVHRPDLVSHLITMGAPCPGTNVYAAGDGPSEGMKALIAAYRDPSPARIRALVEIMCFDKAHATDELSEMRSQAARRHPEHLQAYLDNGGSPAKADFGALAGRLSGVSAPLLAIHGRDDRVVTFENSLRLTASVPDSRLLLLNRCGHWAQIEHADVFNRAVLDFVLHH